MFGKTVTIAIALALISAVPAIARDVKPTEAMQRGIRNVGLQINGARKVLEAITKPPRRQQGERSGDYARRKAEWKEQHAPLMQSKAWKPILAVAKIANSISVTGNAIPSPRKTRNLVKALVIASNALAEAGLDERAEEFIGMAKSIIGAMKTLAETTLQEASTLNESRESNGTVRKERQRMWDGIASVFGEDGLAGEWKRIQKESDPDAYANIFERYVRFYVSTYKLYEDLARVVQPEQKSYRPDRSEPFYEGGPYDERRRSNVQERWRRIVTPGMRVVPSWAGSQRLESRRPITTVNRTNRYLGQTVTDRLVRSRIPDRTDRRRADRNRSSTVDDKGHTPVCEQKRTDP